MDLKLDTAPSRASTTRVSPATMADTRSVLLGDSNPAIPLPAAPELTAALVSIARGLRKKVLLPLAGAPAELALVRQGRSVLVSHYETGSSPNVVVLHRRVALDEALEVCAGATAAVAQRETDPVTRQIATRIAEQARHPNVIVEVDEEAPPVLRQGGRSTKPSRAVPLAFGFRAWIPTGEGFSDHATDRADLHALLFEGELWAYLHGRRSAVLQGPILLAVQRMVGALAALIDAWDAGRPLSLRITVGSLQLGMRVNTSGVCDVSLGSQGADPISAASLTLPEVAQPILRLGSDLCRALISIDRSQGHNLRVRELRDRIGELRRLIRQRETSDSFTNRDTDRMLVALRDHTRLEAHADGFPVGALRYTERWRVALEGLDTSTVFLCGDRLVLEAGRQTLALSRDHGEVLWVRDAIGMSSWLAGDTLVRVGTEGELELCRVEDGEPYATSRVRPPSGNRLQGVVLRSRGLPPMAVLTEGHGELVGIDLRTAEARWRFNTPLAIDPSQGERPRLRRAGRVLIATYNDGSVNALDILNGEVLWRFRDRERLEFAPAILDDVVIVLSGHSRSARGSIYGIDLLTGEPRWTHALTAPCNTAPVATRCGALVATGRAERELALFDAAGAQRWRVADPGLAAGGGVLALDDSVLLHTPDGSLLSLDLDTGSERWARQLSDPHFDDRPQRLTPALRGGAVFVPSASVHVLRPTDGAPLSELPCDLVPDLLRVDERGGVFVAEASGYLAAYAPAPHLRLVPGGLANR